MKLKYEKKPKKYDVKRFQGQLISKHSVGGQLQAAGMDVDLKKIFMPLKEISTIRPAANQDFIDFLDPLFQTKGLIEKV